MSSEDHHKSNDLGPTAEEIVTPPVPGNPSAQILLKKTSVALLTTYNLINQRYYARKRHQGHLKKKSRRKEDEKMHDYVLQAKERLNDRYVVDSIIGRGSFGKVVKAFDEVNKENVAIKIVKSKSAFFNQAQIEIRILQTLHATPEGEACNIVRMKDSFAHHNHQCIVFELLSYNLYELLRDTGFYGVSLTLTRKFGVQLLRALEYTASTQKGIIHCDLKPENILLRNPRHSAIKVIDFGSACFQDQKLYTYIQSRFYRSPEVLLGCPYSTAIDMWSLGCILVEMHTGRPIFNGANEREQVAMQVATLGLPPVWMLEKGRKSAKFFRHNSRTDEWELNVILTDREKARVNKRTRNLRDILGVLTHGPNGVRRQEKYGHTVRDYSLFEDLIRRMLDYDPTTRILPHIARKHKFFIAHADSATQTDVSIPSAAEQVPAELEEQMPNVDLDTSNIEVSETDSTEPQVYTTSNSAPPLINRAQAAYLAECLPPPESRTYPTVFTVSLGVQATIWSAKHPSSTDVSTSSINNKRG